MGQLCNLSDPSHTPLPTGPATCFKPDRLIICRMMCCHLCYPLETLNIFSPLSKICTFQSMHPSKYAPFKNMYKNLHIPMLKFRFECENFGEATKIDCTLQLGMHILYCLYLLFYNFSHLTAIFGLTSLCEFH